MPCVFLDRCGAMQAKHPSALADFDQLISRAQERRLAVFLDYDGTLSPIVEDPDRAFMSDEVPTDPSSSPTLPHPSSLLPLPLPLAPGPEVYPRVHPEVCPQVCLGCALGCALRFARGVCRGVCSCRCGRW